MERHRQEEGRALTTNDHDKSQLSSLTVEQQNAITVLLTGLSDREVAETVGVCRETVTKWRLYHPAFRAELNRQRHELWEHGLDRMRSLVPRAMAALEAVLNDPENPNRGRVALEILKFVKLPDDFPAFHGPDTPEEVIMSEAWSRKNRFSLIGDEPTAQDLHQVIKELEENLN